MKYFSVIFLFVSFKCFADLSPAKEIKAKNSKCVIKSTAGNYPMYTVLKEGKEIFKPQTDGIVNAKISPSGNYVALSAGEIGLLDLDSSKFQYGLVVINCETEKKLGLRKDKPSRIKSWNKDEEIQLGDETIDLKGNLP